jgi:hypothetical protein
MNSNVESNSIGRQSSHKGAWEWNWVPPKLLNPNPQKTWTMRLLLEYWNCGRI